MAQQELTIFQRLTKTFGFQGNTVSPPPPSFQFSKDELLKTDSKEEYEQALLQAKQTQYIADKWSKLDMSLYNQSVYYEPNRLSAYYDYESMEFSISAETKIATPEGFITIKELADKGKDHEFITYAYDHNLEKVVPAKAYNAHYTRDEMTYKITFDDDSHIIATHGHRFLKRDGVFCEVENLKNGDSMMPFYRKSFYDNQNYNWIYSCNSKEGHHGWVPEHNLIAEWDQRKLKKGEEVHHIDFNGKNNSPKNLKIMNINEHRSYHAKIHNEKMWMNEEYRLKMSDVAKRKGKHFWGGRRSGKNNPSYFKLGVNDIVSSAETNKTIRRVSNDLKISVPKIQRTLKFNGFKNWYNFLNFYNIERSGIDRVGENNNNFKKIPWDLLVEVAKHNVTTENTSKALNVSKKKILSTIRHGGFNEWSTFLDAYGIEKSKHYHPRKKINSESLVNHKIKSIKPYGVVPVYDLTVPGYKNFATDTIFSHNTPEVSAALDIYAEESTTKSEKGQILTIHSDSKRIKAILDDLFYNVLDINTNIQMWTRGMAKYGDNFVYLKIDAAKGIIGCQQLPNIEIQRLEGARQSSPNQSDRVSSKFPTRELRFTWNNKDMEFQAWEVAHFRILGDDRKLPYGTSMLDKIRRIWKQLLLAEDAMLIYRTSRAPERRVFKVFVGNMDDKDIEPYVQRIANKFKRDQIVDQKNGQVDMRYNQMAVDQDYFIPMRDISQSSPIETLPGACISLDTKIPLLDGRTLELKDIISEWDNGNRDLWVYSVNPKTGESAPGLITWAGVTRKDADVLRITLDNGEEVITTPDHKFVHRTNGFVEAQDLSVGDSLMPFYTRTKKIRKNTSDYHQIWNNKKQEWEYTHRNVNNFAKKCGFSTNWCYNKKYLNEDKKIIHHKDLNRFNNNPENLINMNGGDHMKYHQSVIKETIWKNPDENKLKISKGLKSYINNLNDVEYEKRHERLKQYATVEQIQNLLDWRKNGENNKLVGKRISESFTDDRRKKYSKQCKDNWRRDSYREKVFSKPQNINFNDYFYNTYVKEFKKHKRSDLTIIELNKNPEFLKNFRDSNSGIRSSITNLNEITHNHVDKMVKGRGFKNFREWKKCILMNHNHKISKIEWLDERRDTGTITVDGDERYHNYHTFAISSGIYIKNSNLGEIADIEYIQKKMLAALRIPKAFLGFEDVVGNGKGLALLDIRFARTINRIQQSLVQELNKIALIHLFLLGMEDELNNFTLMMTNPSGQSDLLKIESWKEKITMYKDATSDQSQMGILPVSHTWAKKNILGMSDNEVILDLQQQRMERAIGAELMNTPQIIRRTGVFDDVDKKYGISEEERKKIEDALASGGTEAEGGMPGGGGGSMSTDPMGGDEGGLPGVDTGAPAGAAGGEPPLSESKKEKPYVSSARKESILSMLSEDTNIEHLFDNKKAQDNIYEIEKVITDIINENDNEQPKK